MNEEQISIINRVVDHTMAGEVSWRRDHQYLIGTDNDGCRYCLQPGIDLSDTDFTQIDAEQNYEEALMEIATGLRFPEITIIGEDGSLSIKASQPSVNEQVPETTDLKVFHNLTTAALRSMVREIRNQG